MLLAVVSTAGVLALWLLPTILGCGALSIAYCLCSISFGVRRPGQAGCQFFHGQLTLPWNMRAFAATVRAIALASLARGQYARVSIADIQNVTADAGGTCLDSPLDDQDVSITGIVMKTSGSSYYSTHHGFYLQDSDTPFSGIYVYVGTGNVAVTEGDLVEVNGTVYECAALADDDARALSQILRIGGSLSSLSGTGDSRRSHPSPARPC